MYKPIGLQVKTYRFSCAKPIGFCPLKLCFLSAVSQLFVYACTKIVDTTERYRLNELTLSSLSSQVFSRSLGDVSSLSLHI